MIDQEKLMQKKIQELRNQQANHEAYSEKFLDYETQIRRIKESIVRYKELKKLGFI